MKKKKIKPIKITHKVHNRYNLYFVFLTILGIFGIVFLIIGIFNEPQFTIYKEECWNEIQEIGLDYYNEKSYGENYNIISYEIKIKDFGFYKLDDDFCIDYISSQTNKSFILISSEFYDKGVGLECIGREITSINKNYYNMSSKIEYLISVEEAKEIFPELNFDKSKVYIKNGAIYNKNKYFWVVIDVIRNKSICEKVEVQTIQTDKWERIKTENCGNIECSNECVFANDNKSTNLFRNPKTREECDIINQEFFYKNIISKKDLTKEWLDENCGCFNYASYMGFFGKISSPTIDPKVFNEIKEDCIKHDDYNGADFCKAINNGKIRCSKYKCFENYYVEVN